MPDAQATSEDGRAVRADRDRRRSVEAVGRRPARAREAGRGVEDHRRAVPAPGLGRQRGDAARPGARRDARRARAAALLPDQQGTRGRGSITTSRSCPARRRSRRAPTSIRTARRRPRSSAGSSRCPKPSARAPPASSRRSAASGGSFTLVPYSVEYQNELARAAALLREAAALATEPTLKTFLTKRADAFLSNDYYDSDVAWMELKGAIEPTIGPYEVYEDELFNYKAAFESFITVQRRSRDRQAAEVRRRAAGHREPPADRSEAPQPEARRAGADRRRQRDLRRRRRATAACRPRPSTCRTTSASSREKGAKRVMLKNVQDAKFAKTLMPISKVVLVARRSEGRCRSTPSSRTSSCTS